MTKVIESADAAVALIPDGATIMMGGFGLAGIPENLVAALHRRATRNLTIVSNNAGIDGAGIGLLLTSRQVRKKKAHPASDVQAGGWTPSTGGDLFACVDEHVADDGDYIYSTVTPDQETAILTLESLSLPKAGTITLRVRSRWAA